MPQVKRVKAHQAKSDDINFCSLHSKCVVIGFDRLLKNHIIFSGFQQAIQIFLVNYKSINNGNILKNGLKLSICVEDK